MYDQISWSVVRKNSCFLVKSQGLTLTKEPNNLMGINNFKYNGYVNKKAVGVEAKGKGVVLSLKKKGANKPASSVHKTTLTGSRHAMKAIKNTLVANNYRKDLVEPAMRRACAIIRSQSASLVKKSRSRRKKN